MDDETNKISEMKGRWWLQGGEKGNGMMGVICHLV